MKMFLGFLTTIALLFFTSVAPATVNFGNNANLINIQAVTSTSASGDSSAVDMLAYDGQCIAIGESHIVSADPTSTLTFKLKESATSGGTYTDVVGGGFTQATSADTSEAIVFNKNNQKRYLKFSRTLVGPSAYLISGKVVCQKKYK